MGTGKGIAVGIGIAVVAVVAFIFLSGNTGSLAKLNPIDMTQSFQNKSTGVLEQSSTTKVSYNKTLIQQKIGLQPKEIHSIVYTTEKADKAQIIGSIGISGAGAVDITDGGFSTRVFGSSYGAPVGNKGYYEPYNWKIPSGTSRIIVLENISQQESVTLTLNLMVHYENSISQKVS